MKQRTKQALAFMLVMMLAITAVPMQAKAAAKISATSKTLNVGETLTLRVTGTNAKVKWTSSNKKVASVTQKGKVSAKQVGTATITAKASKKTLKCKVTVKAKFSANEATKKISCTLQDTGKGVVAILKNNNKMTVSINVKLVYYSKGKMIDTVSDENGSFESGSECALFFHAPYDSNYKDVDYSDFKITMSVEEGSSYLVSDASKIKVKSDMGTDNVSAEVTNTSKKSLEYIKLATVFYDSSNKAIGFDERYAECKTSGSVDYVSFDFPYDDEYNTITPSNYKIYVNYAYKYNW